MMRFVWENRGGPYPPRAIEEIGLRSPGNQRLALPSETWPKAGRDDRSTIEALMREISTDPTRLSSHCSTSTTTQKRE